MSRKRIWRSISVPVENIWRRLQDLGRGAHEREAFEWRGRGRDVAAVTAAHTHLQREPVAVGVQE
jgi:hypothetical protein